MSTGSMTAYQAFYRDYQLPWSTNSDEQEQKFRRILTITLAVLLVLSVIWPFLPTPQKDPSEVVEIEQRFAQLILEERELPPPPPPRVEEEPEEVEPEPVAETEPEPEPEPVVQEVEPEPVVAPDPEPAARERASVAGLLPFSDDLAALRDNSVVEQVSNSRDLTGAVGASERNERNLITSNVGASSGGINTAQLSRNTGGTGLSGRSTTQVETPVAAIGNGRSADDADVQRSGSSNRGSRSREEIETVFDRNKGAIYALYNRALRQDPTLEGKLVLRITIAPDGVVTLCEVASSELNNPELERKLVARVKLFRFESKDVEAITTTKPIDFFPA